MANGENQKELYAHQYVELNNHVIELMTKFDSSFENIQINIDKLHFDIKDELSNIKKQTSKDDEIVVELIETKINAHISISNETFRNLKENFEKITTKNCIDIELLNKDVDKKILSCKEECKQKIDNFEKFLTTAQEKLSEHIEKMQERKEAEHKKIDERLNGIKEKKEIEHKKIDDRINQLQTKIIIIAIIISILCASVPEVLGIFQFLL